MKSLFFVLSFFFIFFSYLQATEEKQPSTSPDIETVFREAIEALNQRNHQKMDSLINLKKLCQIAFKDLDLPKPFVRGFLNAASKKEMGKQFLSFFPPEGKMKILRIKPIKNGKRFLVRTGPGERGLMYTDFFVTQNLNKKIEILDWYDYAMGQHYQKTIQQIALISASGIDSTTSRLFKKLMGIKSDKKSKEIENLFALAGKQKFKEAYLYYEKMDVSFKKSKTLALMATQLAQKTGKEELYRRSLDSLAQYFESDPSIAFILIDHYFYKKEYDKGLHCSNLFAKEIGTEDAGILFLKANIYLEQGKLDDAITYSQKAIKLEPDFENPYWILTCSYIIKKDYQNVTDSLKKLQKIFGHQFKAEIFDADPMYEDFKKSKEFKAWMKSK